MKTLNVTLFLEDVGFSSFYWSDEADRAFPAWVMLVTWRGKLALVI